jgi:pimeloyl-ACP methyl ester carboxylesterase
MGGGIGWGIAKVAPQRFRSLIIGGAAPYDRDPQTPSSWPDLFRKGMETVLATVEPMFGSRWTPELRAMIQANDLEALIALTSVQERLGMEELLPAITLPCLVYVGELAEEASGVKACVKHMPNATLLVLPGINHGEAMTRIDLVLPHVRAFLVSVEAQMVGSTHSQKDM